MNSKKNILPTSRMDVCSGSCARKSIHRAQQYFMVLLATTVVICLYMELFLLSNTFPAGPPPVREKKFITVEVGDGRRLGNVMFSYASLIGIAKRHNLTTLMPSNFRLPAIFKVHASLSKDVVNSLGIFTNYEEFGRRACAYDMGVEKMPSMPTRLYGYFQSWKYFENAMSEVRDEFTLQPDVLAKAKQILNSLVSPSLIENTILVGIHVRRGDITQDYYRNYGYTTPEKEYYVKAVDYMKKKFGLHGKPITFVVCSDDIKWAKDNLAGIDNQLVFSEGNSDYIDLALLIQCHHTIISVGSFGWWAGWLAGGTVVYYDKWPREYSMLEYHVTKHHYFLSTWVPIR